MAIDPESFTKGFIVGSEIRRRREIAEKEIVPYLTFSSPSSFTLAIGKSTKTWDGKLEYSTNTQNWTEWDGTTTLSSGSDNKLYLRGTGNSVICGVPSGALYHWVLTGTDISCIGNVENLLDYTIVKSGQHPTMAYNCYSFMFRGCTSLIRAPDLPATTLAEQCYYSMFAGCTSLVSAPELPATMLDERCYADMFSGCTSLTTVPELPATMLTERCYYFMFNNCTKIKLSETQTDEYQTPFRIPESGDGSAGLDSTFYMFSGTGGTFTGTPEINMTYYTSNEIV